MKAKTKLIATIMAMCLVITLGVFGILAVKTLNMSVGGNITFSADGLSLEVSAGEFKTTGGEAYSNITTQSGKLQGFEINTDTKLSAIQSKIDSWTNLQLALDSKGDAVLHFSVTNKMTTPLYVYVATNLGTNTNNNMALIVSPNGTEIGAGATTNFTIAFDILDMNINAGLAGFNVEINFTKENLIKTQYKLDGNGQPTSVVDYYYVEMGTYNGEPLKWRYAADETGVVYEDLTVVPSLKGYYVLETVIETTKQYLSADKYDSTTNKFKDAAYSSIIASDYGLSDIRAYFRNEDDGGFLQEFGILKNDKIYSIITGRTLEDLYTSDSITSEDLTHSLSLSGENSISNQIDKLWLMSLNESNNFFTSDITRCGQHMPYWLRSSRLDADVYVREKILAGSIVWYNVDSTCALRPAFKI